MKVFAIIPAHNEEDGIEKTLLSIINQTYKVEKILVACDNCTDNTEEICEKMSSQYHNIFYFSTVNNYKRKAGALNQAFSRIEREDWDFLLQMDADSILREDLIEEGIEEFSKNPKLGGICSRFRVGEYVGGNYFLYTLQYLEYSFFDSIQVEKKMNTHVLSGTASLLRKESIISLRPSPWDENSIVEDYTLTLVMKERGWKVKVGKNMHITTDYMHSWKDLWKQRRRWMYGTVEELEKKGWTKYTRSDIMTQGSNLLFGFFQIIFIFAIAHLITSGQIYGWHPLGIVVPAVIFLNKIYRSKYIERKSFFNLLIANSLLPEYLYSLFLIICMFSCHFRLLFKIQPKW